MKDPLRLYIPEITDQLLLAEDWTFKLIPEYRNEALMDWMRVPAKDRYHGNAAESLRRAIDVTLPKGTVLKVSRIYVRQGNSDYSSLTFWGAAPKSAPRPPGTLCPFKGRFFAKLDDVNRIVFTPFTPPPPSPRRGRAAAADAGKVPAEEEI